MSAEAAESTGFTELVLDDNGHEIDPNGLIFAAEKEQSSDESRAPDGSEKTETGAGKPATENEAAEGAEKSEADDKEPAPAPETTDKKDEEVVYQIEGEDVSLADLKQGWTYIQQAIEVGKEAEAAREAAQATLEALAGNPTEAMLGVFTALAGDDRQKGYQSLVDFASRIVANHIEQEGMPEEKREALRWKAEADRLRAELDDRQRTIQQREAAQIEAQEEQTLRRDIGAAITAAGQEVSEGLVKAVAGQLYDAFSAGLKMSAGAAVQLALKKQAKETASARTKYLGGLSKADLAALPKEVLAAIRKMDIEALTETNGEPKAPQGRAPAKKREAAGKMRRVAW